MHFGSTTLHASNDSDNGVADVQQLVTRAKQYGSGEPAEAQDWKHIEVGNASGVTTVVRVFRGPCAANRMADVCARRRECR